MNRSDPEPPSGAEHPDPDAKAAPAAAPSARPTPAATSTSARLVGALRNPSLPMLAGFAVVVAIMVVLTQTTPPPPGALRPLPADPDAIVAASSGEPVPGAVSEAIAAYGAGDLERAVGLLASTAAGGLADELRRVYLGSALALLHRPEEALEALGPETDPALPEPWLGEARWTRAIALRDAGRTEEANRALADLAAGQGPVADRARRLLASEAE